MTSVPSHASPLRLWRRSYAWKHSWFSFLPSFTRLTCHFKDTSVKRHSSFNFLETSPYPVTSFPFAPIPFPSPPSHLLLSLPPTNIAVKKEGSPDLTPLCRISKVKQDGGLANTRAATPPGEDARHCPPQPLGNNGEHLYINNWGYS